MRKINILYDNLLLQLSNLTVHSEVFTNYYENLTEDLQKEKIIDLSELIINETTRIANAKVELTFLTDFTPLISILDDFKDNFNDFPGFRKKEIYGMISIIQKLSSELDGNDDLDLNLEVDIDKFNLTEIDQSINKDNFFHLDSIDPLNSLLLFNLEKMEKFKLFINDEMNFNEEILFTLLNNLGQVGNELNDSKYILVRNEYFDKPKVVWATLCLHIVKSGDTIHQAYEYSATPHFSNISTITLGKKYQQFADTLDILSEYNYQKDILDKYLRVYHVFENFMYKSPLVELERNSLGQVFSIRDFKRMYDNINKSESQMLKGLMDEIIDLSFETGITYKQHIINEWNLFLTSNFHDTTKINQMLKILRVLKGNNDPFEHADVNASNVSPFFAKLIYSFRNSIVHNRETEFHLTHLNLLTHPILGNTAKIFLENFIIPLMEKIIFSLITNENDVVWYDQDILKLWYKD